MSGQLDLSSYSNILQTSFVKITVPDYGILRMSNYDVPIMITESDGNAYSYTPMGTILAISEFNNELTPSRADVTISLAAIDSAFIPAMMGYKIKGSPVEIRRAFFDTTTKQMLSIAGNPSLRFTGVIANYSFTDTLNDYTQSNTTTISVSCSSIITILQSKLSGQVTNDAIRKTLYPGDIVKFVNDGAGSGFQFEVMSTDRYGGITSIGQVYAGSGYSNGSFTNVALTGGAVNNGAKCSMTVVGGEVTDINITYPGSGYSGPDRSFDRVAVIATTNFNFGAPA